MQDNIEKVRTLRKLLLHEKTTNTAKKVRVTTNIANIKFIVAEIDALINEDVAWARLQDDKNAKSVQIYECLSRIKNLITSLENDNY